MCKKKIRIPVGQKGLNCCVLYRVAGFFRGPIFSRIANGSEFREFFFAISAKRVGALREEGVAAKISRNIFSRQAVIREIREIRENKCPRKIQTS